MFSAAVPDEWEQNIQIRRSVFMDPPGKIGTGTGVGFIPRHHAPTDLLMDPVRICQQVNKHILGRHAKTLYPAFSAVARSSAEIKRMGSTI
jgi:hypothetical protein